MGSSSFTKSDAASPSIYMCTSMGVTPCRQPACSNLRCKTGQIASASGGTTAFASLSEDQSVDTLTLA